MSTVKQSIQIRIRLWSRAVVFAALLVFVVPPLTVRAEEKLASSTVFKANMSEVYRSFSKLQRYIYDRDVFEAKKNEKEIAGLLKTLSARFHTAESVQGNYGEDPGFASTLQVAKDMLTDASNRFREGKKSYALWRIKSSSTYCISCHTRHEVSADFFKEGEQNLNHLDLYEQADFYFATRQFDKASAVYRKVVEAPSYAFYRLDALRKWLVIYTRVHPSPTLALEEMEQLQSRVAFTAYERAEIDGWIDSLRRWSAEDVSLVDSVPRAEALIRQGIGGDGIILSGKRRTVELLRATAMLHRIYDSKDGKLGEQRAQALYLLGLAYSEIPALFVNELPEMFLEQCIRDYPGTDEAKRSFNLFEELLSASYTGSGGTSIPDDDKLKLEELRETAFGTKRPQNRVDAS